MIERRPGPQVVHCRYSRKLDAEQDLRERGFTLVELAVAAGVVFVLTLTLAGMCRFALCAQKKSEDLIEVQDNLVIAVDRMVRELRCAREIAPASNHTAVFFVDAGGSAVSYYLEGGVLKRRKEVEDPVANWITALHFEYQPFGCADRALVPQNTRVKITVTGEKGKSGPVQLTTQVKLRSK